MAAEREKRLGRGIESLLGAASENRLDTKTIESEGKKIESVALKKISANPYQPRRSFDPEKLQELKESLMTHGLMQPILVRRFGEKFQLVAGERRFRAAMEAGWDSISAVIVDLDDRKLREWAIIENIQRQDLGPIEIAESLRALGDSYSLSVSEVAKAVGMSRPAVSNLLRLLQLPDSVKEMVSRGTLSMGSARALMALEDQGQLVKLAAQFAEQQLSVRQVEEAVRQALASAASPSLGESSNPLSNLNAKQIDADDLASHLTVKTGMKITVRGSDRQGRVTIHYASKWELERFSRYLEGFNVLEDGSPETDPPDSSNASSQRLPV